MAIEYFCCYHSYAKKCEKLTDQELGRLFRALMKYSETGERQELAGRESIAFDFIADDIDRAKEAYAERCRKNRDNGKKAQEQTAPNGTDRHRTVPNGTQDKDKNKEKEKDKTNTSPPYPPSWGEGLRSVMDSWLAYKAEKKQGYKPQGLKSLVTQVDGYAAKYGENLVISVIQRSMAANYQGIVWDWLQKSSGQAGWKPGKAQGADQKSAQDVQANDLDWLQNYMKNREEGGTPE